MKFEAAVCGVLGLVVVSVSCAVEKPETKTGLEETVTNAAVAPAPAPEAPKPAQLGFEQKIAAAAKQPVSTVEGDDWHAMFDGESLAGWKPTPFAGRAEVEVISGLMVCNMGDPFTGVNYTNRFPELNYEITLEAMRLSGSDFFCGLTVPFETNSCSLVVGGWGGGLVGISSVDGMDASENETTKFYNFEPGRWYRIRLRVTENWIEGWIGENKAVNLEVTGRRLSVRPGDIELSMPMGIASWQTCGVYRDIKYRQVTGPADLPKKKRRAE